MEISILLNSFELRTKTKSLCNQIKCSSVEFGWIKVVKPNRIQIQPTSGREGRSTYSCFFPLQVLNKLIPTEVQNSNDLEGLAKQIIMVSTTVKKPNNILLVVPFSPASSKLSSILCNRYKTRPIPSSSSSPMLQNQDPNTNWDLVCFTRTKETRILLKIPHALVCRRWWAVYIAWKEPVESKNTVAFENW